MAEKIEVDKTSYWQRIFAQSRCNNGPYIGEHLPRWPMRWPEGTWLKTRMALIKEREVNGNNSSMSKMRKGV